MLSAAQVGYLFSATSSADSAGIDASLLLTPTQTQVPIKRPRGFDTPAVLAPWQDTAKTQTPLDQKISRIKSQSSFINSNGALLRQTRDNADLKTTFTLFKALDDLKTLAEYAADTKRTAAERAQASAQFDKGMRDVQAFTDSAATRQLNLLFGEKTTRAESIFIAKPPAAYAGLGLVANSKTESLKSLTTADTFEIQLSRSTSGTVVQTDTIHVDFADLIEPLTLDKVLARINDRIAAAPLRDDAGDPLLDGQGNTVSAYKSRFVLAPDTSGKLGLKLNPGTNEAISLADPAAPPAAFAVTNFLAKDRKSDGVGAFSRVETGADGLLARASLGTIAGVDAAATAFAKAVFATVPQPTRATAPRIPEPGDVTTPTRVAATAVDSKGFIYTVGTASGDIGTQQGDARADMILSKYDSNGVLVFARKLGAAGDSSGASLVIDSQDNVIVAGHTSANLGTKNVLGGDDMMVTKFSSSGAELFAVALDSLASDRARAVSVDAAGDIYVGGQVTGSLAGATSSGGQDAVLVKLSGADGALVARTQFGTSGADSVDALAVRADGRIAAATTENGVVTVHLFDGADLAAGSVQSASLGLGSARALVYDSATNQLVIAGSTISGLNGVGGFSGGSDGFAVALDEALAVSGGTHIGSSGSDFVDSLQVVNGQIMLGGRTNGTLGLKKTGSVDGFVAQYDLASFDRTGLIQFGETDGTASHVTLAAIAHGPGTLAKLGLRQGDLGTDVTSDLLNATSLRAGDHFFVAVDGGRAKKVEIAAGESFKSLASKLRTMFGTRIDVRVTDSTTGAKFEIRQKGDSKVELRSGADGKDVLAKLGMSPVKLLSSKILFNLSASSTTKKDEQRPGGTFNFGLTTDLSIADQNSAQFVSKKMADAVGKVQTAYRSLYFDEFRARAALTSGRNGTVPAYLLKQTSNYQEALSRLGLSTSTGLLA